MKTRTWNGRAKSPPNFNHRTGTYYGRGIISGKTQRIYRKGKYTVRQIFKKRFNKNRFSKWISKYK